MQNILVTLNVLNYNTFDKTSLCIDSCLKQNGSFFRVLLIDNCSTDDSYIKLREKYGNKIDYLQTGNNYGYAKGNNLGVQFSLDSGCDYSFLLNSDTELIGNDLTKLLLRIMQKYDDCGIVSPLIYDVTSNGLLPVYNESFYVKLLRIFGVLPKNRRIDNTIETKSEAHGSALFVDNKKFLECGGFPEHYFMYAEESLFSKKILWSGANIYWLNDKCNYVLHHHDTSKSIDSWRKFLMGRNASLEYLENRKGKSRLWFMAFIIYVLRSLISCASENKIVHIKGLIAGIKQYRRGLTKEELFDCGRQAKDIIV